MSRLFQLPVELVEIIASFLPPEDLFNLRLTCRELSTKTFHCFTQKHFTMKQFFPSPYGLEALLAISKSRLRESLRTVVLGPQDFNTTVFPITGRDEEDRKQSLQGYLRYINENRYMRQTGLDAIILQEAFANLPNCSTLEIRDYSLLTTKSDEWWCDDIHPLSSYGESEFSKVAAGWNSPKDKAAFTQITRTFTIALHAAVTAKLPLESVITDYEMSWNENETPLDLPSPRWFDPSDCSLKKLLHLQLYIACFNDFRKPGWAGMVDRIVQFFILAPNINRLGLNLAYRRSAGSFLVRLADTPDFGNITTLDLTWICTDQDSIINAFTRLSSKISCLKLCGFKLYDGNIRDIFEFIGDKMQLKKIYGQWFWEYYFGIAFKSPGSKTGSATPDCFCYEGPDIINFMKDLISSMVMVDVSQIGWKHHRRFWPHSLQT
jgi:F-box domain